MKESNELNDIILNKGGAANNNKKVILAVATLGVILIIIVLLMNSLTSNGTDNLPQAVLPPKPSIANAQVVQEETLFEEVEVIEEESINNDNLDRIAKKLKEESLAEKEQAPEKIVETKTVEVPKKQVTVKKPVLVQKAQTPKVKKVALTGNYYIQVGSFSKYEPNKKFLKSIQDLGYTYKYHKVTKNSKTLNKVLVGPFSDDVKAKDARRIIRAKIEPGAFLVKL